MKIGMPHPRLFILISLISLISITGLYAYAVTFDITSVGEIEDDGTTLLGNPREVIVIDLDGKSTAIVTSRTNDGIEIIDVSNPSNPISLGRCADIVSGGGSCGDRLNDTWGVDTYTKDGSTYAVVTSLDEDSVEIIDISDPASPTSVGSLQDTTDLDGASFLKITTIGSSTYAVVAATNVDRVTIVDITDPTTPTKVGSLEDDDNKKDCTASEVCLDAPKSVDVYTVGGSTYAVVGAQVDDGIEIIDISDPTAPASVGRFTDNDSSCSTDGDGGCELNNPTGLEIFSIGDTTYVVVASQEDSGIQILDITDPTSPTHVSELEDDGTNTLLNDPRDVHVFSIDTSTYVLVSDCDDALGDSGCGGGGVQIIDITTPTSPTAVGKLAEADDTTMELGGVAYSTVYTFNNSTGTYVYAIALGYTDNGIEMIHLHTGDPTVTTTSSTSTTSSTCARLVILGNCGTIAINNDVYQIIDPWSTVPTTEVIVGEPVSITLSTPHNYVAGKINSVSVYTEIFGSPTNYELGSHIDYSVMKSDYYVSESELFQVAGATHRIVQDTDVKNLELFEVVFMMVFAKPMDMSYIVVEIKNMHGISETIYLRNALKVIESPIELLTHEEKSKFELIFEPELKDSLRPDMDIEPNVDVLAIDPEPVSKVTCGNGTMVKDDLCVPDEMSFYFFINQFMRLLG